MTSDDFDDGNNNRKQLMSIAQEQRRQRRRQLQKKSEGPPPKPRSQIGNHETRDSSLSKLSPSRISKKWKQSKKVSALKPQTNDCSNHPNQHQNGNQHHSESIQFQHTNERKSKTRGKNMDKNATENISSRSGYITPPSSNGRILKDSQQANLNQRTASEWNKISKRSDEHKAFHEVDRNRALHETRKSASYLPPTSNEFSSTPTQYLKNNAIHFQDSEYTRQQYPLPGEDGIRRNREQRGEAKDNNNGDSMINGTHHRDVYYLSNDKNTHQYSQPRTRHIDEYEEDHENPPPIISKASSISLHEQERISSPNSFDSFGNQSNNFSRASNHSLSHTRSEELRETFRMSSSSNNQSIVKHSSQNQYSHLTASNNHFHYPPQHPSAHVNSYQIPRDDATADYTTVTEDSGGMRTSQSHIEQRPETFRSSSSSQFRSSSSQYPLEYGDFDDETTVFDANTVNTNDDDDSKMQQHQLRQRGYDMYANSGYSSLGEGAETKPNTFHSSSEDTDGNQTASKDEICTNETQTDVKSRRNDSTSSGDSEDVTQLVSMDDDSKSEKWETSQPQKSKDMNRKKSKRKNSEDFERQKIFKEENNVKIVAGCTAVATIGAIIIGPIGIVVGASVAGLVGGYYQIPPTKREKVANIAKSSLSKATDEALKTSEKISSSCVTAFEKNGIDLPDGCLKNRNQEDGESVVGPPTWLVSQFDIKENPSDGEETKRDKDDDGTIESEADGLLGNLGGVIGGVGGDAGEKTRRRTVACLRKTRITPIGQIYALSPGLQPRAWLDVMASALTSDAEKNEAMEEILILVKNKDYAQLFLDEGILDSLMYILSTSFQKLPPPAPEVSETDGSAIFHDKSRIPRNNETFIHAKLAANCCVALGKAHCAVVHTEGDLLLMSAYNRGSVPVERQLAQLLFEVPHHSRMLGTGVGEVLEDGMQEEFILTEMSMQQAEEMAKNIKALLEGRLDWN